MAAAVLATALAIPAGPAYPVPADQVAYERCVAHRESNDNPRSTNRANGYFGKYQFSQPLTRGATWMMLDWLATWHPQPKRLAAQLRATEMHRWPANLQLAAFIETLNHEGKWSGMSHWAGGRWTCGKGGRP